jgi:uncharacterized protein YjbI with pentapeptide repeats
MTHSFVKFKNSYSLKYFFSVINTLNKKEKLMKKYVLLSLFISSISGSFAYNETHYKDLIEKINNAEEKIQEKGKDFIQKLNNQKEKIQEKEKKELQQKLEDLKEKIFKKEKISCKNKDLSGADLSKKDLLYIDFTKTNMEGCNLNEAKIKGAKLDEVILRFSSCIKTTIIDTSLQHADVRFVDFHSAVLTNVNLLNSFISGSVFVGEKASSIIDSSKKNVLKNIRHKKDTVEYKTFKNPQNNNTDEKIRNFIHLYQDYLKNPNDYVSHSDIKTYDDLKNFNTITQISEKKNDTKNVMKLESIDASHLNFEKLKFPPLICEKVNFQRSNFFQSLLEKSIFKECSFYDANLTLTSFKGSSLEGTSLSESLLYLANMRDTFHDIHTKFSEKHIHDDLVFDAKENFTESEEEEESSDEESKKKKKKKKIKKEPPFIPVFQFSNFEGAKGLENNNYFEKYKNSVFLKKEDEEKFLKLQQKLMSGKYKNKKEENVKYLNAYGILRNPETL